MRKRTDWVLRSLCVLFTLFLVSCGGGGGGGNSSNNTSSQKIDAMTAVMDSGAIYYKNSTKSGVSSDEAVTLTIAWLKKQDGIIDATYDKDKIIVKDVTGISTVIVTNDNYLINEQALANKLSLKSSLSKSVSLSQTTIKALIIKPSFVLAQNASRVYDTLLSNGSDVTYLKDDSVTVKSLAELKNYDIIYYFGHGAISNTKIEKDKRDVTPLGIMTGEPFSADKVKNYSKPITDLGLPLDYKEDGTNQYLFRFTAPNILGGDSSKSSIGVTSLYIQAIAKDLKASIVYIDACHSLESEAMADAFLSNGAKTYYGWNKSVNPTFTYGYPQSILSDLFAGQYAETAYNKLLFNSSNAILLARGEGKTKLPTFNLTPPSTYSVSGKVTSNGNGLQGVSVTLTGNASPTLITNATGDFKFTNVANGNYALSAVKTGYIFTPSSITNITVNGADVIDQKFSATVAQSSVYSLSGTIYSVSNSGPVLSGATVWIAGKKAITSVTGTFSITGIPAGTYSFSVSKSGYDTYTNPAYYVGSNQIGLKHYLTVANSSLACSESRSFSTDGVQFYGTTSYQVSTTAPASLTWGAYYQNIYNFTTGSYSGSLRARLWAVPYSFSGGLLNAYVIGTFIPNFTGTGAHSSNQLYVGGYSTIPTSSSVSGQNPPTGTYCIVVTIEEYNTLGGCSEPDGYCYDQWIQFSGPMGFL